VIAATGSFNSARGIGSQASVGAAVDEERWVGKTHLLASLMLAQSERFERLTTLLITDIRLVISHVHPQGDAH